MEAKQELLRRLQQISSEKLGVKQEEITEESTWTQLGADSLDRLEMSRAIEDAFKVEIPHAVGERLNTVRETVDHLLTLIALRREISNIRIEAVTTNQQWAEMLGIRTQVFTIEYGFQFKPLPGPGETRIWHFLARDNHDAIGTLSVVDITGDRQVRQRYRLSFGDNDRVARYAQLAILKPYRKRGIFEMLLETAQSTVIRSNRFDFGWLLYPAAHARSSGLTRRLGFAAEAPLLKTEFGSCHVLVRREPSSPQVHWTEESFPIVETCPI
ncbi:MAG TPA: phosphopantetheine-binding protein [Terriglobales bacterium]|nr:phosphopantetheine-binding protein [Terriglobales bacterium]